MREATRQEIEDVQPDHGQPIRIIPEYKGPDEELINEIESDDGLVTDGGTGEHNSDASSSETVSCTECNREIAVEQASEVPDGREQIECECGNYLVECAECGDFVSVMESASGMGRKPVHRDCFSGLGGTDS